jgi:pimeloyl-ACP methyl ester carboxylesterase
VSTPAIDRLHALGSSIDDVVEVPLWIPSREMLGGIVSIPSGESSDLGVVLMAGRARDRCHRNGMFARAARELAGRGMYVLRLDYPGVGHSSGDPQIFDLESPPAWAVEEAARFLVKETPVERVILAGTCFGARVVLGAAQRIPDVASVAVIAAPVYTRRPSLRRRLQSIPLRLLGMDHSDGAADNGAQQRREGNLATEQRVSPSFERAIRAVMDRCPVYFLYGADDFCWEELQFALDRLHLPEDRYELEVVPGIVHAFRSTDVQDLTIQRLSGWCSRFVSAPVASR